MKIAKQLGRRWSAFGLAAVMALGLTLGSTARATACCVGDCDQSGDVTVDELIIMVNIALGTADASACANGVPAGVEVDITLIIQAVNNALVAPECVTPFECGGGGTCGNGVVEPPETCDNGGTCIGGSNANTHCTAEADCSGDGICQGGTKYFFACADDNGCPGGKCIHCKTFGGTDNHDGTFCAANCTVQTDITMTLLPGVKDGLKIVPGTSGAVVHSEILTIPLPLTGTQIVSIGAKGPDGLVPATVPASSIQFPRIPVSSIACACLRGVATRTCGGTLYDIDGVTPSEDCTPEFTAGDSVCTDKGLHPCSFLHGPGNAASGNVGCGPNGFTPVNVLYDLDSGGSSGVPGNPLITLSGSGPTGSGLLLSNSAIGTVAGLCSGTDASKYGPDGELCKVINGVDDDPQGSRGNPSAQMQVTGRATGKIENANGVDGDDVGGPFFVDGHILSCDTLLTPPHSVTGAGLASSFVSLNQPTTGDVIVTSDLVGQ